MIDIHITHDENDFDPTLYISGSYHILKKEEIARLINACNDYLGKPNKKEDNTIQYKGDGPAIQTAQRFEKSMKTVPARDDPWKHRSSGMKCRTCIWHVRKILINDGNKLIDMDGNSQKPGVGRCRRHAPTMNGYPVCYEDDWCGDHKVDENKV